MSLRFGRLVSPWLQSSDSIDLVSERFAAQGAQDLFGAFGAEFLAAFFTVEGGMGIENESVMRRMFRIPPCPQDGRIQ